MSLAEKRVGRTELVTLMERMTAMGHTTQWLKADLGHECIELLLDHCAEFYQEERVMASLRYPLELEHHRAHEDLKNRLVSVFTAVRDHDLPTALLHLREGFIAHCYSWDDLFLSWAKENGLEVNL